MATGRGQNRQSFAKQVLIDLANLLEDLPTYAANPGGILYAGGLDAYRDKQEIRELKRKRAALYRLKRQRLVEIQKKGGQMYVQLTEKGIISALREQIAQTKTKLPKGQACYVSFDIPQPVRSLRSLLRIVLKESTFHMLHQSLWVSLYGVGKPMALLVTLLKAEEWVHVFVGTVMTNEKPKK